MTLARTARVAVAGAAVLAQQGCFAVMQYERQYLGDTIMRLEPDPMEENLNRHIMPRREGSSGGNGGTGGGCGC